MSLIASLWCYPLSYLSHLKIIWISLSVSFLPQISKVFVPYWRLNRLVVFITRLWDENLLLKLFKFRYLYFSKCSFVCNFVYKCIGGCVYNSPYPFFWKHLHLFLYSFLSGSSFNTLNIFKMRLDMPQESSKCLIFVTYPDFMLTSSSLKALRK